jgi:hypothetical protein
MMKLYRHHTLLGALCLVLLGCPQPQEGESVINVNLNTLSSKSVTPVETADIVNLSFQMPTNAEAYLVYTNTNEGGSAGFPSVSYRSLTATKSDFYRESERALIREFLENKRNNPNNS